MARSVIPDPMNRRYQIEKALPESESLAIAEAYLAEDRATEALDFLLKAGAEDRIATLRQEAVETGNAFLLREIARRLKIEPDPSEWLALANQAEARGLERYAATARRQATVGDED